MTKLLQCSFLCLGIISLAFVSRPASCQDHDGNKQMAQGLMQKIIALKQEQAELKQRLGRQHPKLVNLENQLKALQDQLAVVEAVSQTENANAKAMLLRDVRAVSENLKKLYPHIRDNSGFDEVAEAVENLQRAVNKLQIKSKLVDRLAQSDLEKAKRQLDQKNAVLRAQQQAILKKEYDLLIANQNDKLAQMQADIADAEKKVDQQRAQAAKMALRAAMDLERAEAAKGEAEAKRRKKQSDSRIDRIEIEIKEIKDMLRQILKNKSN